MAKARAVVQVGDKHFETQQFDVPCIGPDDALMRVEACGICGSDVDQYDGKLNGLLSLPMIPGHEPVGIIEEIGAEAARRWRLQAGDRVAVEPTRGEGADVVVDVTAETMAPIVQAVEMARPGGTIILAGVKGPTAAIPDLKNDRIFSKELTIRGVKNADFDSFAIAVQLIEAHKYPFEKMHTHSFALSDLERAIKTLAGRVAGEQAVSVSLDPLL